MKWESLINLPLQLSNELCFGGFGFGFVLNKKQKPFVLVLKGKAWQSCVNLVIWLEAGHLCRESWQRLSLSVYTEHGTSSLALRQAAPSRVVACFRVFSLVSEQCSLILAEIITGSVWPGRI